MTLRVLRHGTELLEQRQFFPMPQFRSIFDEKIYAYGTTNDGGTNHVGL